MISKQQTRILVIIGVGISLIINIILLLRLENNLSVISMDSFSEANTVRAGQGYYEQGFEKYAGLPDVNYGRLYPNEGFAWQFPIKPYVYTHYPPLAEWLTGVLTYVWGEGQLRLFRLLPISLGLIALAAMLYQICAYLDNMWRAYIFLGFFFLLPMNTMYLHHLHSQSYPLALLWGMVAVMMRRYNNTKPESGGSIEWKPTFWIAILAFLQGWLTFDYFFIVAGVPYLVSLLYLSLPSRKQMLAFTIASIGGFTLAHILHLGEVALYYGSLEQALTDIITAAKERQGISQSRYHDCGSLCQQILQEGFLRGRLHLIFIYLFTDPMSKHYWLIPFGFILLALNIFAGKIPLWPGKPVLYPPAGVGRMLWVSTASLLVGLGWIIAMPSHGAIHFHIIERHFFITWFIPTLFLLKYAALEEQGLVMEQGVPLLCGHNSKRRRGWRLECIVCGSFIDLKTKPGYEYDETYGQKSGHYNIAVAKLKVKSLMSWLSQCGIKLKGKHICEIGFGGGACLAYAAAEGASIAGIESNTHSLALLKKRFPQASLFNEREMPTKLDKAVDLWFMFDVFEHIMQPESFLDFISVNSAPGAKVLVVIPRADSFSRLLLGRLWPYICPDHYFHWSRSGIIDFWQLRGWVMKKEFTAKKFISLSMVLRMVLGKLQQKIPFTPHEYAWMDKIRITISMGQIGLLFQKS